MSALHKKGVKIVVKLALKVDSTGIQYRDEGLNSVH